MNANQKTLDPKDVYPGRFLKGSRGEKVSPSNLHRPLFMLESAGLGKMGHPSVKGNQQRDILHLQWKKTMLSEPALSNCPGPYGWELYRLTDENVSAQSQFILYKKVISAGFTLICTGTGQFLSNRVPMCLVYCSGCWHTTFSYPLNISYIRFYFITLY